MPLYQQFSLIYPQDMVVKLTIARVYRDNNNYKEAVTAYSELVEQHTDNTLIRQEWLNLLLGNAS